MGQDRAAFGAFLRARRDRMTPAQAGLTPLPGPRRVPGLRRDEVALLAALSTDHYSRLEQGRQAAVSESVLRALTRALRLDETEAVVRSGDPAAKQMLTSIYISLGQELQQQLKRLRKEGSKKEIDAYVLRKSDGWCMKVSKRQGGEIESHLNDCYVYIDVFLSV